MRDTCPVSTLKQREWSNCENQGKCELVVCHVPTEIFAQHTVLCHMCIHVRKLHILSQTLCQCNGERKHLNSNQIQNKLLRNHFHTITNIWAQYFSTVLFYLFCVSCLILSPLSAAQLSEMTKWLWNEWNPQSPQVVAFKKLAMGKNTSYEQTFDPQRATQEQGNYF